MKLTKTILLLLLFSNFIPGCTDQKIQPIKEELKKIQYQGETRTISEGDSIQIYGGKKHFLSAEFAKDTLRAKISNLNSFKCMGRIGVLDEIRSQEGNFYCIGLSFFNSEYGYTKQSLYSFSKLPDSIDTGDLDPLGCPYESELIETELEIRKIE